LILERHFVLAGLDPAIQHWITGSQQVMTRQRTKKAALGRLFRFRVCGNQNL
jgi:hypothetical protein